MGMMNTINLMCFVKSTTIFLLVFVGHKTTRLLWIYHVSLAFSIYLLFDFYLQDL
jgi:hypothetical protein